MTINMLDDDVLLEIFDFYRRRLSWHGIMWKWQKLVHVCRRWRYVILESPQRLNLQIACNSRTPTRELLDVWPPFPISLSCYSAWSEDTRGNHNVFAALQRRNRISQIDFTNMTCMDVEYFAAVMDEPFPILTVLCIGQPAPDPGVEPQAFTAELPDSFLGGSAPCLQSFVLEGVVFPALPNLVLSASHFQYLHLHHIPHAWYIPPELMVTVLLPLRSLKGLTIGFTDSESRSWPMGPPPLTHTLLPSLTEFKFHGTSEYLLDFIARIDTPILDSFEMMFISGFIPNVFQFHEFIDRTDKLKNFIRADVYLRPWEVQAIFKPPTNPRLDITCEALDWPLSSMVELWERLLTIPSQVEQLELCGDHWDEVNFSNEKAWLEELDDPRWLELLNPFVSVRTLYVSKWLVPFVAFALAKLTGERATEVLPRLENLFLEGLGSLGFVEKYIKSVVSVRQYSGHPVIVRWWKGKPEFGF